MTQESQKGYIPSFEVYGEGGTDTITSFGSERHTNSVVFPLDFLEHMDTSDEYNIAHLRRYLDTISLRGVGFSPLTGPAKDWLKTHGTGDLEDRVRYSHPIPLGGGNLSLVFMDRIGGYASHADLLVPATAVGAQVTGTPTIVTLRSSIRKRFEMLGIDVESPRFLITDENIVKSGLVEVDADIGQRVMEAFYQHGKGDERVPLPKGQLEEILGVALHINQVLEIDDGKSLTYARVKGTFTNTNGFDIDVSDERVEIDRPNLHDAMVFDLVPKNAYQYFTLQSLLDPNISLVFIAGSHGSGKTLLSYLAGVDVVTASDSHYAARFVRNGRTHQEAIAAASSRPNRMVILKPDDLIGGDDRETGFKPGDIFAKTGWQLRSYEDAHRHSKVLSRIPFTAMMAISELERGPGDDTGKKKKDQDPYANFKIDDRHAFRGYPPIQFEHGPELRGRTLSGIYFIIDEAQNLKGSELKDYVSRAGIGTKTIVIGDPLQLDNARLTVAHNAFTEAIAFYHGKPYAAIHELQGNFRGLPSLHAQEWKPRR